MKLSSEQWKNLEQEQGKLEKDLTVAEFKAKFGISDEEFEKSLKRAQSNEYGTQDLKFNDEEGDMLVAEYDGEMITHLYAD
jgi:hypothetical protein